MNACFVMQPFDGDVFDERYEAVFCPGIKKAGIDPYRVDRDPGVSIPIDDIESGIRNAQFCFADITTDNPNVWFELGFAIALAKDVVLVCSEERTTHFPFDVQHRSVIKYRTGAPQYFVELEQKITDRITALLKKQEEIAHLSTISPIKNTAGLSQHEIVALVTVAQNQFVSDEYVPVWTIKGNMNQAGFTNIAVSLAMKALISKEMVHRKTVVSEHEENYVGFVVTANGDQWLMQNQDQLVMKDESHKPFSY